MWIVLSQQNYNLQIHPPKFLDEIINIMVWMGKLKNQTHMDKINYLANILRKTAHVKDEFWACWQLD